ncbi:MAG: putative DNA binding domain-containing protein [Betaproteobacteria bacterium]|nr:putative DNA binding domain-containing protein [Betaproteobacteria bacterium]
MLRTELTEIIEIGENSGVEFKRDDIHPDQLAKELVALLNLNGGRVLLGVDDDKTISGLTRSIQDAETWVMNVCRNNIQPPVIPYWEVFDLGGMSVAVVTVPADSPDKPYKARRGNAWITYVRVGTTSRDATREEEARLYQAAHLMRYDIKAVSGAGMAELDRQRVANYFVDILRQQCPAPDDEEAWSRILLNTDLLVSGADRHFATVGGLLLFGANPNRFLPQAGITATVFPGQEKDYATVDEEVIRGPLVSVFLRRGRVVDMGVIDRAISFVERNMGTVAWLEGGKRRRKKAYPVEAVREAIVNAVAHRDYTITVTDIELSMYSNRIELISPGRLPNTVTVEKMKQGYRAARNELIKETLRDYGYIEHRGMGVRNRIIEGMREHNGTESDLIEEEDRFIVRLWKEAQQV